MTAELHLYQCGNCRTTMTTAVKAPYGHSYRCNACYSWMRFLLSDPIETETQRALAAEGMVFNPGIRLNVKRVWKRPCSTCRTPMEPGTEIELSGVGRFCSPACTDAGVKEHERFMMRIAEHRQQMPWLYENEEK